MSTNYTENYNLCQWEASDKVLRTDFNADNAKLETALTRIEGTANAAKSAAGAAYTDTRPPFVVGKYSGNDASVTGVRQTIALGFRPRAVLVFPVGRGISYEASSTFYNQAALAVAGVSGVGVEIYDKGFRVYDSAASYTRVFLNTDINQYVYIAFR